MADIKKRNVDVPQNGFQALVLAGLENVDQKSGRTIDLGRVKAGYRLLVRASDETLFQDFIKRFSRKSFNRQVEDLHAIYNVDRVLRAGKRKIKSDTTSYYKDFSDSRKALVAELYKAVHVPKEILSVFHRIHRDIDRFIHDEKKYSLSEKEGVEKLLKHLEHIYNKHVPEDLRVNHIPDLNYTKQDKGFSNLGEYRHEISVVFVADTKDKRKQYASTAVLVHEFQHFFQFYMADLHQSWQKDGAHAEHIFAKNKNWESYAVLCKDNFDFYEKYRDHEVQEARYNAQFVEYDSNIYVTKKFYEPELNIQPVSTKGIYEDIPLKALNADQKKAHHVLRDMFGVIPIKPVQKQNGQTGLFIQAYDQKTAQMMQSNMKMLFGVDIFQAPVVDHNGEYGVLLKKMHSVIDGAEYYRKSDLKHRDLVLDLNIQTYSRSEKITYNSEKLAAHTIKMRKILGEERDS